MTIRKKATAVNITEGVIWKQLLIFFFPILFGTVFQQLYNTVDAVIVGKYVGKEALAAVGGSSAQIVNLLVGFFVGVSSGASVVISQFFGAQDKKQIHHAIHTAMALAVTGGVGIMVLGLLFCRPALTALNTPADVIDLSLTYMRIIFPGVIPALIYNMGAGILRAVGDSRRPLYFLIVCCGSNIILDFVFVVFLNLGVLGVAVATTLAQTLSAVLVLWTLINTEDVYKLVLRDIRFHKKILGSIIRIGLPSGFQSSLYAISNILVQSSINSLGTNTMAAWTAFDKVDCIQWMTLSAFGIAVTTFAGQNYGAGKIDRVRKSVRICLGIAMTNAIFMSFLVWTFAPFLFGLFTNDAAVIEIGVRMSGIITRCYFTYVCVEILGGACRGCGDAFVPMLITCVCICVLRSGWLLVMFPRFHSVETICIGYPLTWAAASLIYILYYLSNRWLRPKSTGTAN